MDEECFDNTVNVKPTVEATGKDSEESTDQCDLNLEEKEWWGCTTPKTMAYIPKATEYSNQKVKAEVKFSQVKPFNNKFISNI